MNRKKKQSRDDKIIGSYRPATPEDYHSWHSMGGKKKNTVNWCCKVYKLYEKFVIEEQLAANSSVYCLLYPT